MNIKKRKTGKKPSKRSKIILSKADDEGAAYGMLAKAYERIGDREKAKAVYEKGIEVSMAHGHPTMANDYKITIDLDYDDVLTDSLKLPVSDIFDIL